MASGEPEPGAEVRWDWPDGGGAPFDASEATTRWVLVVGNTFGRTWPAGDLLDFGSWTTDFERRVPMGYKTIRATERLAVVDRGTVVREWPPTRQERPQPVHDPYQHHVPGFEPDGTFAVLDGQGSKRGPDVSPEPQPHGDKLREEIPGAAKAKQKASKATA